MQCELKLVQFYIFGTLKYLYLYLLRWQLTVAVCQLIKIVKLIEHSEHCQTS